MLTLDVSRGDLTIHYDASARESRLTVHPDGWRAGCGLRLDGDGRVATARIEHDSGLAGLSCRSRVELILAGQTSLSVRVGVGNVFTDASPGRQDIQVGTGRVTGSIGAGRVSVDQGRVSLGGLTEGLEVRVNVGGILLDYIAPPSDNLSAQVDVGNVVVHLPAGSEISPGVYATLGLREQQFSHTPEARVRVDVESRLGNARLLAVQGAAPISGGDR